MLQLSPKHQQTIYTHAESTYPEECCGIILGYLTNESKTVVEVIPTENAWNAETAPDDFRNDTEFSKRRRYTIAPQTMLQVQKEARDRELNIIGIYHSHPDYPANPSEFDRQYAWQEYSYIIVSVQNGQAGDIKSWTLDDNHQFQQEAIELRGCL
ncbi:MAG: M67 family metallopeptidase [Scytonema sp. PMC 1069.18]|nr:M67 family metallopeptidase [Scytonema sp. PMC 1069.18]MEC4886920.1 M67 family metallopeptidase [Scytonema sp. PMC 1070.18]